jgi:hypothetical protein
MIGDHTLPLADSASALPGQPPAPKRYRLDLIIDADLYARLTGRSLLESRSIVDLATALLNDSIVRCTEDEHGSKLAGELKTAAELADLELRATRNDYYSALDEIKQLHYQILSLNRRVRELIGEDEDDE